MGNSGKHTLVGPEDVLGGSYTEAEVKKAKKRLAKAGGGDIIAALEFSRKELREMAQTLRSKVSSTVKEFDPFGVLGVKMERLRSYDRHFGFTPPTERQIQALSKQGVPAQQLEGISKRGATKLFEALKKRTDEKLATLNQARALSKFYPGAENLSFEQASKAITYVKDAGWGKMKPVTREALEALING